MPASPEAWTPQLRYEFDRYVATLLVPEGTRYRYPGTGNTISASELDQIRVDVIANATTDATSLAYQMLLESGLSAHLSDPCPTCDAAVRFAWGASATRRALGLPASNDITSDVTAHRVAV
jgi:hypothetical protein